MITSIVTFLSTRFVTLLVTAIVVVVTVPMLIITIHNNAVGRPAGVVASPAKHSADERTQTNIKVKAGSDDAQPGGDEVDDGE